MTADARRAVERAARASRSRLLAFLAARSHDLAAAEDALSEAFRAALETWPQQGVPDKPEAWLLTTARHRLIDAARQQRVHALAEPMLLALADEAQELALGTVEFPDERLKLLFVCAHPAIDAGARTPLMLQTVLGLDAARIASAFLVQPAAMGQRLARAKRKIRDAGIAFEVPDVPALPARLDAVLEAIYAAYGSGWDDIAGADARRRGLAAEALELGRLLRQLLPHLAEAAGLLALMLHCEARRPARRAANGAYVPLTQQDPAQWSWPLIAEAEQLLQQAATLGAPGRFQLEAAIQSLHARRAEHGVTDWDGIATLYEGLIRRAPTIGARLGQVAAIAESRGAREAWTLLQTVPEDAVQTHQPYWALAAHLLQRLGRTAEAEAARSRAIGLAEDAAVRAFLESGA